MVCACKTQQCEIPEERALSRQARCSQRNLSLGVIYGAKRSFKIIVCLLADCVIFK